MVFHVYLSHIFEEILTTPSVQAPIIIVLLVPANAKRAIAPAAATQESSATQFHLAIIYSMHWRSDDIPIGLRIEIIRPPILLVNESSICETVHHTLLSYVHSPDPYYVVRLR